MNSHAKIDSLHSQDIDELFTELEWSILGIRDRWKQLADQFLHHAVDQDELLASRNAIAIVWDVQHVKDQRPDLCQEKAWRVLKECQLLFDRLNDPMLDMIRRVADKLYPARRYDRTDKAGKIIAGHDDGAEQENLVDLLTDIRHWCERFGISFDSFLELSRKHFDEENQPLTKGIRS